MREAQRLVTVGRFATREYAVRAAGHVLRIVGPACPERLLEEPAVAHRFAVDEYLPYWAEPWPAAVMLANEAQRSVSSEAGPILEIGAGLGVTSVAMAKAGYRVVATDYDEEALAFIRANARLNNAELAGVCYCDWRDPPPGTYPVVIGSDVLYEVRHIEPLSRFLNAVLAVEGQAMISTPARAASASFPAAAREAGLHVETITAETSSIAQCGETDETVIRGRVYRVRKPK